MGLALLSGAWLWRYAPNPPVTEAHLLPLLVAAWLSCAALFIGWHSRLAALALWCLLLGFTQNSYALASHTSLFFTLLAWACLLPLDAQLSLAKARASNFGSVPQGLFSVAGVGLQLSVMLYFFAAPQGLAQPWLVALGAALALSCVPALTGTLRLLSVSFAALAVCFWLLKQPQDLSGYILLCSLLPLVPARFWNSFGPSGAGLTIFYDGGCSFCLRMVKAICTLYALPQARIRAAFEDPDALRIMQRETSWVVRRQDGKTDVRAGAMQLLLEASPLLWPAAGLLSLPFLRQQADALYNAIAYNRPTVGQKVAWLEPRPLRLHESWLERLLSLIVLACVGYVVVLQ